MFKPMLAATLEDGYEKHLQYPRIVSPKLDGIRALLHNGGLYSRRLKTIPNHYTRHLFEHSNFNYLDGELIVGEPHGEGVFNRTTSGVMSMDGSPEVTYHVFDIFSDKPFSKRFERVQKLLSAMPKHWQVVPHHMVYNVEQLYQFESTMLTMGYEGVMLRDPEGRYKQGRSTLREGWLLKLKRFISAEAKILDFEEQMHNANEAIINQLGKTKRSHHQENMIPKGTLGALVVQDLSTGVVFNVGTGFDDELRAEIWGRRKKYKDQIIRYKYQPVGVKDRPRHPVFEGFRKDL